MTPWETIIDELFFAGKKREDPHAAGVAAAEAVMPEAQTAEAVTEEAAASPITPKPMSLWDSVVDEIFFGGREAKALAEAEAAADNPAIADVQACEAVQGACAVAEEACEVTDDVCDAADEACTVTDEICEAAIEVCCGEEAVSPACETAAEAEVIPAAPLQPASPVTRKPMSLWVSVVDEIFFGGREAKALAEAEAVRACEAAQEVCAVADESGEATVDACCEEKKPDEACEQEAAEAQPAETPEAAAPAAAYDFSAAEEKMNALQQKLRQLKIPMVIVVEGWQASGKGTIAGELLEGLDPRGYDVHVPARFSGEEALDSTLRPYWIRMPRQGMISLFIGSWYHDLCAAMVRDKRKNQPERQLEQIRLMEQMLLCDGAVIEKFFLDIPAKVQKKRLKDLASRKSTKATLTKADWEQNRQYDRWQQAWQLAIEETRQPGADWHILNGEDKKACKQAVYETIITAMEQAIARTEAGQRSWDAEALEDHDPIGVEAIQELAFYETDRPLDKEYKLALKTAQKKLHKLQYELSRKGIPLIVAFEGWDAAGKGGVIRRLTAGLDPRGYTVTPIASPTAEEKEHHHLWRFWKALPRKGDISVFDRTWYGRVMVERLEGFCTQPQWKRAYEEMNLFEQDITGSGAILCKFWLHISSEEQLKRFNKRMADKPWKICDEDWRNREKWDQYEEAVNDMLKKTNTAYAPWTVVEADNKHFARIKVLEGIIAAVEKRLGGE